MVIDEFKGEYSWLSNFFETPVAFEEEFYPTVEHAFQAAKTRTISRREWFKRGSAAQAKRLGRSIPLRRDWEEIKVRVMRDCVQSKFDLSPSLRTRLLETGDRLLVEGNTWGDTFWGVCNGVGENTLGSILMDVRKGYKREAPPHRT